MDNQARLALEAGNPALALQHLQQQVRQQPADPKLRIFLFQLLAVLGQWERALTQLNVCGELDGTNLLMVESYREAIQCECLREQIFKGQTTPVVLGQPEPWLAHLMEALRLGATGHFTEASLQRDAAFDAAPATTGTIDGVPFDWIADADTRLGPVLEAILNGRYVWIPFNRLARIELDPPSDLRDLVWTPARLTFSHGGESVAFIPARYPGSGVAPDGLLALGRRTEWQELGEGHFWGLGQRLLTTSAGDHALLETRVIELLPSVELAEPTEESDG